MSIDFVSWFPCSGWLRQSSWAAAAATWWYQAQLPMGVKGWRIASVNGAKLLEGAVKSAITDAHRTPAGFTVRFVDPLLRRKSSIRAASSPLENAASNPDPDSFHLRLHLLPLLTWGLRLFVRLHLPLPDCRKRLQLLGLPSLGVTK
jgi:hypothetical protein